jgi:hypothetical protein
MSARLSPIKLVFQILPAAAIATDLSFDGAVNPIWRIFQRQFTGASRKSIFGCFRPSKPSFVKRKAMTV